MTRQPGSLTAFAVLIASGLIAPGASVLAQTPQGLPPTATLLVRFDADMDQVITRAEMEAGVRADYATADLDHNNCLNANETRLENENRLRRDGGQATPAKDWNVDGCLNLQEFAGAVRSYFTFVDKTKDGTVSMNELRGPAMPLPVFVEPTPKGNREAGPAAVDAPPSVRY